MLDIFSTLVGFRYFIVRWLKEFLFRLRGRLAGIFTSGESIEVADLACFVINLDHRVDRWEAVCAQLDLLDFLKYERVSAVRFSPGYIGCNISHIIALGRAFERGLPAVLICEDDILFTSNSAYIKRCIDEFMSSNADVLCLGKNSSVDIGAGKYLRRSLHTQTASCYVVKKSAYAWLIKNFSESLGMAFSGCDYNLCAIDQHWKLLQLNHKFMIPSQEVLIQSGSYSDIENKFVDYRT